MGVKISKEMTLMMWSKNEMKERTKDPQTGEWKDTGRTEEKTKYYLRDEFGDTLEFISGNEYREMEGSLVEVNMDISFNDFQNKNVVKLDSITQLA